MDRQPQPQTHAPHPSPQPAQTWLEDEFVRLLGKHLVAGAQCHTQLRVATLFGPQQLDLRVQAGAFAVGFLYDGWTARSGFEDLWTDAALVGARAVHVVYRLRRRDIEAHLEDIHYVVSRSDPRLFSARGTINAARLASSWAQQRRLPQEHVQVCYPQLLDDVDLDPSGDPEDCAPEPVLDDSTDCLHMTRRTREQLAWWYRYARDSGLRTVDQVMQRFADEQLAPGDDP